MTAFTQANTKPIRGWYVAHNLPEGVNISRDDIDAVMPSMPCAVLSEKSSNAVLNSPAMSEFNMPQESIEADGLTQHLPALSTDDIVRLIKDYSPKVSAMGITEVWMNIHGDAAELWEIITNKLYDELAFRVRLNFGFDDVAAMNEFLASGLRTGDGLPMCRIGGILVDDNLKQDEQKTMITSAHLSGCQVIAGSSQYSVNTLERMMKKFRKAPRHLIASDGFNSKLLDRMKILDIGGITLSDNPGNELHSAFLNGIVVSAGSGKSLVPPFRNIAAMVSHGLSTSEALCVYSWSAAWNGGAEMRRGLLATGSDADVVVVEKDPFASRPEEIAGLSAAMTFCAGKCVYDR